MKKLVLLIGAISNTEAHRENYRNTERYGTYQSSYYGNHRDQNHNNRNRYDVNQFDRHRTSWSNGYYNRPGKEFTCSKGFQFRWLKIIDISVTFPIWMTLFLNHPNRNYSQNKIRETLTRNVQWIRVSVLLWKINEKISWWSWTWIWMSRWKVLGILWCIMDQVSVN